MYRPLEAGAEGRDVELLEKNLSALGYGGFTVDDAYTAGTADAVRDWQEDLGREETGTVQPGDAVVAPGARRVTEVQAALGAPPNGAVLTWTGTERTVTVQLAVKDEDLVSGEGARATVTLPDGSTAEAKVAEVGTAVTAEPAQEGEAQQQSGEDATLPVTLTVEDQRKLGRYQAAPVDVAFEAETREDVLAVPVEALVALREGGYAVEAVRADGTQYLPVKLGMFSDGLVEVSGQGVTAGLKVGVPK
nr:peptidoglycan-binding domain-containing protein [Streptomyces scabichelini]